MKILAISDNVLPQLEDAQNLSRLYSEAEAVVSCGDMPAPYLEYIVSVLNVPLLYVRGNHDDLYDHMGYPGGDNLHRRIVRFKGVGFAGLEGCIRYNNTPVKYDEGEMLMMVLRLSVKAMIYRIRRGRRIDVIVTHSPPRDIHDMQDRAHRGFRSFRLLMRLLKPRYLLHGHVDTHDSRRPTKTHFGETEVININPVKYLTLDIQ